MSRGQFLRDHVSALRKMGRNAFVRYHRWPVLIGLGMYDHVARSSFHGRATLVAKIDEDDEVRDSKTLVDRVWMICKEDKSGEKAGITLGKTSGNDLVIPEYTLSRSHCEFTLCRDGVMVTDLDSLNGTKIDGVRIETGVPILIPDGAQLTLGRCCFELLSPRRFIARVDEVDSF